ncbi:MAG: carbohydrate ABC transporter permease [Firmicutes bacterium]|nr:carbohydrate ABC transporter permease [Bacillota bacterium]
MMKVSKAARYYLRVVVSILIACIMFFPIYWLILSSLRPISRLFTGKTFLPGSDMTLENYSEVVSNKMFWGFFYNSTKVGLIATVVVILLSALGAYSLARLKFPGSEKLSNMVLFIYMVPQVLLALPIYFWMFNVGLLNTHLGVIVAHIAQGLPFALWMLKGNFSALPPDLEDAARIDGCTWLGALFRVILPLSGPSLVAVAMYTLINSWNNYIFSFMLINRTSLQTLPVGLVNLYQGADAQRWGEIMAASVISMVPIVMVFGLLQKFIVRGLTAGAVKG